MIHAERTGAMAHDVEAEIAEGDALHLTIGRVIVDPVLVAPEAVARMQHRRMLIGDARKLVEPMAREMTEPVEMRFQCLKIMTWQVNRQQVAQTPVDGVEVLSRPVGGKQRGAMVGIGREGPGFLRSTAVGAGDHWTKESMLTTSLPPGVAIAYQLT